MIIAAATEAGFLNASGLGFYHFIGAGIGLINGIVFFPFRSSVLEPYFNLKQKGRRILNVNITKGWLVYNAGVRLY